MNTRKNKKIVSYLDQVGLLRLAVALIFGAMLASSQPALARAVVGNGTASSCNQTSLAAAVAIGGAITFNCGANPITINLTKEIEVLKIATMDGANKITLNGQNNVRIFYVNKYEQANGMTFSLKNITLKNGKASGKDPTMGGCIYTRYATLSIKNSVFSACQASAGGGAIRNLKGNVVVDNSQFIGNTAYEGGGIYADAGAVSMVVRYSTFKNNVAKNNGGGIFAQGSPLTVQYSTFDNNKVTGQASGATPGLGGAVYTQKSNPVSIYYTTFTNNSGFNGGAVFLDRETIGVVEKSTFKGNSSTIQGGGLDNWMSIVSVLNCTFENNLSRDGAGIHNGTSTKMTIEKTVFNYNVSTRHGGGISSNDAPITLNNVRFYANKAGTGLKEYPQGGGFANFGGSVKLTNAYFYKNVVIGTDTYGGGFATNVPSTVINVSFVSNQAIYGGGVFGSNTVTIRNSTFSYNYGNNGSNLRQGTGGKLILQNSIIYKGRNDENCTTSSGQISDGGNNIQYGDTSCIPNKTQVDPLLGTMRNNGGNTLSIAISSNSPARNTGNTSLCPTTDQRQFTRADGKCDIGSYEYGGTTTSARTVDSKPNIEPTTDDTDPVTLKIQAAIRQQMDTNFMAQWLEPESDLTDSQAMPTQVVGLGTQASCTEAALDAALAAGGNITFSCGPAATTINITTEKQVTKNTTLDGGGFITLDGQGKVRVIYVNKDETNNGLTFNLSNITIKNGIASGAKNPVDGGCIFIRNAIVTLNKVTVSGCKAAERGAGIRNLLGKLTVTNSTFTNNTANEGSSIFVDTGTTNTVTGSTFSSNTASNNGAGIFVFNTGLTVSNSTFDKNKATGTAGGATPGLGGAIYTQTGKDVTISGSTFTGNSALDGGAVLVDTNSTLSITDSTFTGNSSTNHGGGLDTFKSNVTVSRTSFINNTSDMGGGVHNGTNNKLTLDRITFTGNTSKEDGGGFRNDDGNWTITNSSFVGNQAGTGSNGSRGGGVANFGGTAKIESSTFANNEVKGTGSFGGGVSSTANITIINSTFTGNKAVSGGAAYANDNSLTLRNSTLKGNIATDKGGAIRESSGASASLQNSIVANNLPENCSASSGTISNGGNNIQFGDVSCFASQAQADPKLGALAENGGPTQTMALGTGSPAIDKANAANCLATDQRGAARVGTCDIGAFEFGGVPSTNPTATPTATVPVQTPTATVPVQTPTATATKPATATPTTGSKLIRLPMLLKAVTSFEVPK